MDTPIYVHELGSMPTVEHWAIVTYETVWIPGDERSKTHPGHGYPESSQKIVNYIAFMDRKSWEHEVKRRASLAFPGGGFSAMYVKPAKVTTSISINTEIDHA